MLVSELKTIGSNLYKVRKAKGYTQAEVAELAELSDRTYADIERGSVSMRVDTLLKICTALHITPNDILVAGHDSAVTERDILEAIKHCSSMEKETVLQLISVYTRSLK
ncbi:MAG: helix-turn-helix transcriptional regulator [Clostridia bacterium]|nr:helix-turn-helix transcriptional regulator [Clostridia bacterium]